MFSTPPPFRKKKKKKKGSPFPKIRKLSKKKGGKKKLKEKKKKALPQNKGITIRSGQSVGEIGLFLSEQWLFDVVVDKHV